MNEIKELDVIFHNLSVRTRNCLLMADVFTLDELLSFEEYELLKFRNFGKKSYNELVDFIQSLGYEFGQKSNNIRMTPELYLLLVKIKKHEGNYTDLVPIINELRSIL